MQTRLQKLELLRRALLIATKQLFPEIPEQDLGVDVRFHRSPEELREEAKVSGLEEVSGTLGSFWLCTEESHGDITIFK